MPGDLRLRPAEWPADTAAATTLLQHYFDWLARLDIVKHRWGTVASELETVWCGDGSVLLLAFAGEVPVGCVGLRRLPQQAGAVELKRLWTSADARGRGLGKFLLRSALERAAQDGATCVLLDTVPDVMPHAVALYREFGFEATERYNESTVHGLAFYRKDLPPNVPADAK